MSLRQLILTHTAKRKSCGAKGKVKFMAGKNQSGKGQTSQQQARKKTAEQRREAIDVVHQKNPQLKKSSVWKKVGTEDLEEIKDAVDSALIEKLRATRDSADEKLRELEGENNQEGDNSGQ